MAGLGKLVLLAGLALLAYTAYQATIYRETLRLTQQEFEGLPLPLLAQLVAAVAASLLGSLAAWGSFQPIRLADVPRVAVARPQRTEFAVFNHRGTLLGGLPHVRGLSAPQIR